MMSQMRKEQKRELNELISNEERARKIRELEIKQEND